MGLMPAPKRVTLTNSKGRSKIYSLIAIGSMVLERAQTLQEFSNHSKSKLDLLMVPHGLMLSSCGRSVH